MKVQSWYIRLLAFVFALVLGAGSAMAQSAVVSFPTLPDGSSWVTALTTIFVSAAGLGLGILGLRLVVKMISSALSMGKGK